MDSRPSPEEQNIINQVFTPEFQKEYQQTENEILAAKQELENIKKEIKNFNIKKQPDSSIVNQHIQDMIDHYKFSTSHIPFKQYEDNNTVNGVIAGLREFENNLPNDPDFRLKFNRFDLTQIEDLLRQAEKYDRMKDEPEAAIPQLFQHNERINRDNKRSRMINDDGTGNLEGMNYLFNSVSQNTTPPGTNSLNMNSRARHDTITNIESMEE